VSLFRLLVCWTRSGVGGQTLALDFVWRRGPDGREQGFPSLGPTFCHLSKGKQVKIPAPGQGLACGNATELREAGGGPGKSSLFFLTVSPDRFLNKITDQGVFTMRVLFREPRGVPSGKALARRVLDRPRIDLLRDGAGRLARAPHLRRRPVHPRRPLKTEASRCPELLVWPY